MKSAVVKCCDACKHSPAGKFCFWCFVQTAAFPLEHFVWEKLPVFRTVAGAMGL